MAADGGMGMGDLDKWLSWVWAPFGGLMIFFVKWVIGNFGEMRRLQSKTAMRMEEQFLAHSNAVNAAISALHEKANAIRSELEAHKVESERRFVSQSDLERTETHLTRGLDDLTRAIERLSDKVH